MRSDFSKVVTERPRAHRNWKYKDVRKGKNQHVWRADEDASATRKQGMRRPHYEGHGNVRDFTDLLGPLTRFLQSRVGKPWRKVHSEICANLKGRNTTQQHILDHLKHMVVTDLRWDAEERILREANWTKFKPLLFSRNWKTFYVDPRDGILKAVTEKMVNKAWKTDRAKIEEMENELKTKDGQVFRKIDGIWYECWMEAKVVQLPDGRWLAQSQVKKRQLGTAELRLRGFSNDDLVDPKGPK